MQKLSRRAALAAVMVFSLLCAGCKPKEAGSPGQGKTPNEDKRNLMAGEFVRAQFLKQQGLAGRIALIEFGLIGCELSGRGLDEMIRMHRGREIPQLAYARVEAAKDKQRFEEYYKEKSPGFTVYHDPDASVAQAFDATVYPCFVLVDKFGRLRYRGKFPQERLEEWVEAAAAETTDPGPDVPLFGAVKLDGAKLLAATKLPDLSGAVKPLGDRMGQAGLLLVFVDTTCPFSGTAIGELPTVAATMAQHKVATALINLEDPAERVQKFYKDRDTGALVLYDVTTGTKLKWNIQGVPTVVFIDARQQIPYNGNAVWADLASAAEKAMGLSQGTIVFSAQGTDYG